MNRRSNRVLTDELTELEEQLVALSLRVAAIRNLNDTATAQAPRRSPIIGDRVRFGIVGRGNHTGIVIGVTAQRIRIRQDDTSHIFLRAPHNVTVL